MATYEGMRWVKCDFQVQTPEDAAHWADAETRLSEPRRPLADQPPAADGSATPRRPDETSIQEVARTFLQRCHEVGLQMVGITDHNFSHKSDPRDWFLTHLVEQNRRVARELGREPLAIFPGFEVDIGYHVLCLFGPARTQRHIWRVNQILTRLGLVEDRRFVRGLPQELRNNNENVSLKTLLEVVQGEHGGMVIAAHSDQNDGLLENARNRHDYQLPQLLAVEVTAQPVPERYREILAGRDRDWGRADRPLALVMSSDAKSLKVDPQTQEPGPNSLGYRHTWVKMSKPSIEALRQSFLDSESRIQLKGLNPADAQNHPRILSVEVRGARFLDDLAVSFSPNLNCVIGGRGSGKSTLLEYLHFALGDGPEVAKDEDPALQKKKTQLVNSLAGGGEVRVAFETAPGLRDVLVYRPGPAGQPNRTIEGREVIDLGTILRQLRASFFSQGELSRMTSGAGGQAHVLQIIDAAAAVELQANASHEAELKVRLNVSFQARRDASELATRLQVITQELQELDRQLEARQSVRDDSRRHQGAVEAQTFFDGLKDSVSDETESLAASGVFLRNQYSVEPTDHWPMTEWLNGSLAKVNAARAALADEVDAALRTFRGKMDEAVGADASSGFLQEVDGISQAFIQACEAKGLKPEDISKLTELMDERKAKDADRQKVAERHEVARASAARLPDLLQQLHQVWRQRFAIRQRMAESIQQSMSQMARIQTTYMGDFESFMAQWRRVMPQDGREKLSKRWDELGTAVHHVWRARASEEAPWETVELASYDTDLALQLATQTREDLLPLLAAHLNSKDVSRVWEDVRTTRVGDGIDVELVTREGVVVGSMNGALSEGQRNTLLLNLLLARGDGPIIIDQPEDELDSSFIYKNLVDDFRKVKSRRQLIVATHNANLPVNGDAELVLALKGETGRGRIQAQGGLDRKEVVEAVLDIMEGSEQAFRRRSEKYHF
ncbi:TrlF family AAA-like ATPase [Roseateles flavus]|uniref:TrlF family AAA-like ATPase n=1 Tax=Roseateles flavus TaxID=3149041 RepID=A0ABV0G8M4_9BURK